MHEFKRNQVEDAILQTLSAEGARIDELKLRIKRLLVTDRRLARGKHSDNQATHRYAFFNQDPPGSGVEIMFSSYEALAIFTGLRLLEHGMPQATAVSTMRQLRADLEAAHSDTLKKDPKVLFDQQAVRKRARPGMLAVDNTDPIFLAIVNDPAPSKAKGKVRASVAVCRGHDELATFLKKYTSLGSAVTISELVRVMHKLAGNLSQTRPVQRGRSTV